MPRAAPEPNDEFDSFVRQAGSYRVIFLQGLCFSQLRTDVLSAMPDSAGPFDQSESMTRQSIELLRIVLARSVLQCIDSAPDVAQL